MIHHFGLSSHTPAVVHALLDRGFLDLVMFSINPPTTTATANTQSALPASAWRCTAAARRSASAFP